MRRLTSSSRGPSKRERLSLMKMIASVLAAGFGVRSAKYHERDFEKGSPAAFLILGLVGAALLVLTLILVVKLVLSIAGV